MAESYGWAGKILRVDLTTGEITTQDDAKYHNYIGDVYKRQVWHRAGSDHQRKPVRYLQGRL